MQRAKAHLHLWWLPSINYWLGTHSEMWDWSLAVDNLRSQTSGCIIFVGVWVELDNLGSCSSSVTHYVCNLGQGSWLYWSILSAPSLNIVITPQFWEKYFCTFHIGLSAAINMYIVMFSFLCLPLTLSRAIMINGIFVLKKYSSTCLTVSIVERMSWNTHRFSALGKNSINDSYHFINVVKNLLFLEW